MSAEDVCGAVSEHGDVCGLPPHDRGLCQSDSPRKHVSSPEKAGRPWCRYRDDALPTPAPQPRRRPPMPDTKIKTVAAPRVIGLDLSLTATGIATWDGRPTSTIVTSAVEEDQRLRRIMVTVRADAWDYVNDEPIELAVIEDLPTHAHSAGITGMVHGAVRVALMEKGVPYALVPPASLKKYATGRGNATKADMRMALYQRAGLDLRDDNQVDAYFLRSMGMRHLGHPIEQLPASHLTVMKKVTWPVTR